jgi:hypothetical protein
LIEEKKLEMYASILNDAKVAALKTLTAIASTTGLLLLLPVQHAQAAPLMPAGQAVMSEFSRSLDARSLVTQISVKVSPTRTRIKANPNIKGKREVYKGRDGKRHVRKVGASAPRINDHRKGPVQVRDSRTGGTSRDHRKR